MDVRPPVPPFDEASAIKKVRMAEDAWNSRDPERVSLAYTEGSIWRNRSRFLTGREEIIRFLKKKWEKELEYRLIKELWAYGGNRIAVRFQYEFHDTMGNWFRAYGNENWEFDADGLMSWRQASINDVKITAGDRKFLWDAPGPRPDGHLGLLELGM